MLEEIPEGMSDGMSEVWGRWVRAGYLAVTLRMLAARTQPQEVTRDPRPPKDGTKPQCFASRRLGLEPSREWGHGYVGCMSEVCRTGGLRVKCMSEEYVERVGGTAGS